MKSNFFDSIKTLGININSNEDLNNHSTMRVGGKAKYFIELKNTERLRDILELANQEKVKVLILGDGSNTLFTGDYDGLVIKNCIKGIHSTFEDENYIELKVGAGENWHKLVEYCVNNNYAGMENLAYIPGTVGAAPVQNIAAYGQVQEDTFVSLEAIHMKTLEIKTFTKEECQFAYRTSVFKTKYPGEYCVINVSYKLRKALQYIPDTSYHSRYESLLGELEQIAKPPYTLKDVFNAVVSIRKKKLPDPSIVGTLGSFFLNPFVTKTKLEKLQKVFPGLQYYPVDKMQYPNLDEEILKTSEIVKIPAGWLLDELGWKGKAIGNVSTFDKQALCVITTGPVSGEDVLKYTNMMKKSVKDATGIDLLSEVNIV